MQPPVTLRKIASEIPAFRVFQPGAYRGEEAVRYAPEDVAAEDPPLVEPGEMRAIAVPSSGGTGFTHFMDGAQKSVAVADQLGFPIYLAHTSAAIVERVERGMVAPTTDWRMEKLALYMPGFVEGRAAIAAAFDVVAFTCDPEAPIEKVRNDLVKRISEDRNDQEKELLQRFDHGVLLTDGNLTNAKRQDGSYKFVVGVVKSHATQHFRSRERALTVLGLRAGERTPAFKPKVSKNQADVYSFYLRLQARPDKSSLYGLVRVELPPETEYLNRSDEIAGWLLHERMPTSLPDPRHDKLLYPIHWIEEYLRALQPTDGRIAQLLG